MDRDRGRDRRFVRLRLPRYRDLDMDVLDYGDEGGEGSEVIVEVEKPAGEFRIRGFSERIAKDLGMAELPLQRGAFKELALREMVSLDANAMEPRDGSESGHIFAAVATLARGDGPQTVHAGFARISESEGDVSMRSATTLHETISETDTVFADVPGHATNQVDFDLASLLSLRRQQALRDLQVNHNGGHPDHQLTNPNRYVRGDGEVTKMGAGESYRPSARPRSPRSDTSRFERDRSPPRRDRPRSPIRDNRARSPPFGADTYNPGGRDRSPLRSPIRYRSRDRTPLRDAPPSWRDRPRPRSPVRARSPLRARSPIRQRSPMRARSPMRPRSPVRARSPPRRFSPRRVDDRRPRSPRRSDLDERDIRRRSRSPFDRNRLPLRARSPLPRRSPPAGPRGGGWRPRSRSPPRRNDRIVNGPTSLTWRRPRSPSPSIDRSSGMNSEHSSRRPSPRPAYRPAPPLDERQTTRSPFTRDRSPPPDVRRSLPRERSPARAASMKSRSPAPQPPRSPPRGPAQPFRAPTGPNGNRNFNAPIRSPPPPRQTTPVPLLPVVARPETVVAPAAPPPSGPRNFNPPPARGGFVPRGASGRGSFSERRPEPASFAERRPEPTWGGAPSRPQPAPSPTPSAQQALPSAPAATAIPTGPRATSSGGEWKLTPPSRSSSISSAPFHGKPFAPAPQPQPRVHPAIANLPQIVPGGKTDPAYAAAVPKELEARIRKTDEDLERMREDLRGREEKLRRGLAQWDRLARESASMGLKAELSERHVRMLAGEGVGGAAF